MFNMAKKKRQGVDAKKRGKRRAGLILQQSEGHVVQKRKRTAI